VAEENNPATPAPVAHNQVDPAAPHTVSDAGFRGPDVAVYSVSGVPVPCPAVVAPAA
jgi:hypothetical protein